MHLWVPLDPWAFGFSQKSVSFRNTFFFFETLTSPSFCLGIMLEEWIRNQVAHNWVNNLPTTNQNFFASNPPDDLGTLIFTRYFDSGVAGEGIQSKTTNEMGMGQNPWTPNKPLRKPTGNDRKANQTFQESYLKSVLTHNQIGLRWPASASCEESLPWLGRISHSNEVELWDEQGLHLFEQGR